MPSRGNECTTDQTTITRAKTAPAPTKEAATHESHSSGSDDEYTVTRFVHPAPDEVSESEASASESESDPEEDHSVDEILPRPAPRPPTPPVPAPRRSQRVRRQPEWLRSGDFVKSQIATPSTPEWMQRAQFINAMVETGVLGKGDDVKATLLRIIAGSM